jgi:hypothetical protein
MLRVVAPISLTKTRALCSHFYSDDEESFENIGTRFLRNFFAFSSRHSFAILATSGFTSGSISGFRFRRFASLGGHVFAILDNLNPAICCHRLKTLDLPPMK